MARAKRMRGEYAHQMFGDGTQQCVFCGARKAMDQFPKNGKTSDGNTAYRQDCKVCYNIRRTENKHKKRHHDFIGGQKRRGEETPELTHVQWKRCLMHFQGACAYCGKPASRGNVLTRDHLEPVVDNGRTTIYNIVPACKSCNSSKGARHYITWFKKQATYDENRVKAIQDWAGTQ